MGEGDCMKNSGDTLLLVEPAALLVEIEKLKKQLKHEEQQHRHWEELAMIFHDALWDELRHTQHTGVN